MPLTLPPQNRLQRMQALLRRVASALFRDPEQKQGPPRYTTGEKKVGPPSDSSREGGRSTPSRSQAEREAELAARLGIHGDALTLAARLTEQPLYIPDLWKSFAGWPVRENRHVDRLRVLVDQTLERVITDERKLRALKKADFGRLIALWYPDAEWAELEVATAYSVWIFIWDDEVDAGDTEVSTDEELAHAYGKESREYMRQALGLEGEDAEAEARAPNANMVLFADVAAYLRAGTDLVQRQRFAQELANFMLQVGIEHAHRLRGSIPTLDVYLDIRSGSVGCAPQIALTDYMLRIRLPESIMESEAMKAIWRETVIICLILNDVYSVQKEIAQGSLFNLVPVMYKNSVIPNLDSVTNQFVLALQQAMKNFERAAEQLARMTASEGQLSTDTAAFVNWCRYFTTGVLAWSLESRRYGMAECSNGDGSLTVVL